MVCEGGIVEGQLYCCVVRDVGKAQWKQSGDGAYRKYFSAARERPSLKTGEVDKPAFCRLYLVVCARQVRKRLQVK